MEEKYVKDEYQFFILRYGVEKFVKDLGSYEGFECGCSCILGGCGCSQDEEVEQYRQLFCLCREGYDKEFFCIKYEYVVYL